MDLDKVNSVDTTAARVILAGFMTISCIYYLYITSGFDIKNDLMDRNNNKTSMIKTEGNTNFSTLYKVFCKVILRPLK